MKVTIFRKKDEVWEYNGHQNQQGMRHAHLVLAFGAKEVIGGQNIYAELRAQFPEACIAICSTAGEIFATSVSDNSLSGVAFLFEQTKVHCASTDIGKHPNSFEAGRFLAQGIEQKELAYVLIISDGSLVNGSELILGINSLLPGNIPITGGLAGDADRFESTLVGVNEEGREGRIVAIAFYGDRFQVSHGSMGGWDVFGLEKTVTRSTGNILYEIGEQNALELYKLYLGKYAAQLPGSALLFPLSIVLPGAAHPVVRTILSIDNDKQAMVFAGDMPEGSKVRFMKANFDRLVDAATHAAEETMRPLQPIPPAFALLISCVGRKLILGKRVDEEVEAVNDFYQDKTLLAGFYSYGEISPLGFGSRCELHNQTMTITTFQEI